MAKFLIIMQEALHGCGSESTNVHIESEAAIYLLFIYKGKLL